MVDDEDISELGLPLKPHRTEDRTGGVVGSIRDGLTNALPQGNSFIHPERGLPVTLKLVEEVDDFCCEVLSGSRVTTVLRGIGELILRLTNDDIKIFLDLN